VRNKGTYESRKNLIEKKSRSSCVNVHRIRTTCISEIRVKPQYFNTLSAKNQAESDAIDSAGRERVHTLYREQTSFLMVPILVLYPPCRTALLSAIEIHTCSRRTRF